MTTDPAKFTSTEVLGHNPTVFPAFSLAFVTEGDDLVPATQDVILSGQAEEGSSFWDIIIPAGLIWKEEGDDGWSRASFPLRAGAFPGRRDPQRRGDLPVSRG